MTVKQLEEAREASRERLSWMIGQAKKQRLKGRISWTLRNAIVNELTRKIQIEKDLSRATAYSNVIGFSLE